MQVQMTIRCSHLQWILTKTVAWGWVNFADLCECKNHCLVPRCLSLRCARKGRREGDFPWSLAVHHQSLAFRARLCHAKNEAPEEEAARTTLQIHIERCHTWLTSMLFIGTKESVYIRKEFNSQRIFLVHQYGRCCIVLEHQYLLWSLSVRQAGPVVSY